MSIDIDNIKSTTVVGFEYDYELNPRLSCSLLGDVPGGLAIQLTKAGGGSDPDTSSQVVIPREHMESFIDFLRLSYGQYLEDKKRARKLALGG